MPAKAQPTWIEGPVEGHNQYHDPIVAGQAYRIGAAELQDGRKLCKAPKPCWCKNCYEAPAIGTFVRLKVNDKGIILEADENATPSAPAGQPALPWEAAPPAALADPEDAIRLRRTVALEQAVLVERDGPDFADVAVILRTAATFAHWIETGELPAPANVRSITSEKPPSNPVGQAERPLAARLADDTAPADGEAPAPSLTPAQVAEWVAHHGLTAAQAFEALGIRSASTVLTDKHVEGWINGDRAHRTAAGALHLIRKAAAE